MLCKVIHTRMFFFFGTGPSQMRRTTRMWGTHKMFYNHIWLSRVPCPASAGNIIFLTAETFVVCLRAAVGLCFSIRETTPHALQESTWLGWISDPGMTQGVFWMPLRSRLDSSRRVSMTFLGSVTSASDGQHGFLRLGGL